MRRRRPTEAETKDRNPLPEKLRRFRVGEWPGARQYAQWEAYSDALFAWTDEHPDIDVYAWTEPLPEIPWDPDLDGI